MKMEKDAKTKEMSKDEPAERREQILQQIVHRRIGFHSWRHKLNTILRAAGVPDSKIPLLTGHRSADMTDWYTTFLETDMEDVTAAQVTLLGAGLPLDRNGEESERCSSESSDAGTSARFATVRLFPGLDVWTDASLGSSRVSS